MNPTTIRSRPRQPPLIYILTCLYLNQSIKKIINLLIDILGFDLVLEEYEEQKERLTCRICTENPVAVAFLPCGHLVCCLDCAPAMRKCPICHELVKGTIKTFFSWYLVLVSIYCKTFFIRGELIFINFMGQLFHKFEKIYNERKFNLMLILQFDWLICLEKNWLYLITWLVFWRHQYIHSPTTN